MLVYKEVTAMVPSRVLEGRGSAEGEEDGEEMVGTHIFDVRR